MAIKVTIDKMVDDENSKTKAYASAEINGFVVHGIRVVDGEKGLFAAMPQRSYEDKDGNKKYAAVVQPTSKESASNLNSAVVSAYEQEFKETLAQEANGLDEANAPTQSM